MTNVETLDQPAYTPEDHQHAEALRDLADNLTAFRADSAIPLGIADAVLPPSWGLATANVLADATDGADGFYAKKATTVDGQPTRPKSGEADHKADKRSYYARMLGLAAREFIHGNTRRSAFILVNAGTVAMRDTLYSLERRPKSGNKPRLNRAKTVVQMGAIDMAVSPIDTTKVGKATVNAAMLAGTAMSWMSYYNFKKEQRARRASAYTNLEHVLATRPYDAVSVDPAELPVLGPHS